MISRDDHLRVTRLLGLEGGQPRGLAEEHDQREAERSTDQGPEGPTAESRSLQRRYQRAGTLLIDHELPVVVSGAKPGGAGVVVDGVVGVVPPPADSWLDVPVDDPFGLPGLGVTSGWRFSQLSY